jgi:Mrp family chromosome partitioning ATPase
MNYNGGLCLVGNTTKEQHTLLTDYDTNTAYSEAFHTLFANIRFHWNNEKTEPFSVRNVHTLLIATPSNYSEQASVPANLAIVAAQSGTPTILVDADLRTPQLEKRFGLGKHLGLSDLLQEEEPVSAQRIIACLQKAYVSGLKLIGVGTSTEKGAALLLSPKLQDVVSCVCDVLARETEESRPGIVIFHSAPVLAGADASLIGAIVEQTLLTIVAGSTTRAQAKQAQEQLQQARARLAGVVMLKP